MSAMTEARVVKFRVIVGYIKGYSLRTTNRPERGVVIYRLTWPIL